MRSFSFMLLLPVNSSLSRIGLSFTVYVTMAPLTPSLVVVEALSKSPEARSLSVSAIAFSSE